MLRTDGILPGSPSDWLRHARADLALAEVALPKDGLYSTLCFHAQQTVEKSLKAVLVREGVEFPKTHSIARLVDLLPSTIPRTPEMVLSSTLTPYATMSRYPTLEDAPDITREQYDQAIRTATAILEWARLFLLERGALSPQL